MLADHAVSLSSPTREPQRGLLLFVAIHVERWSAVLDICQAVNAKSATDATEAQLVASAVPFDSIIIAIARLDEATHIRFAA